MDDLLGLLGDHAALFEDEQARDRLEAVLKKYGTAASAAEAVRRVLAATLGSEEESEVDEGRAADEFSEFYWHRDMLCDTRRNTAFDAAIRHAIKMRQDASAPVHLLDIGTGSGLLALMGAKHGADTVTAIECVPRLADIAELHFKKHEEGARVRLLRGNSRDLNSLDCCGDKKPNLVVAELLETGLLGEGVLPSLRHAAAHLLAPEFDVIPAATRVHAVLLRGSALRESEEIPGHSQSTSQHCSGAAAAWHVHADQLRQKGLISYVSEPFEVFRFDWDGELPGPEGRSATTQVPISSAGSVDGVLMWWTCEMTPGLQDELSTEPGGVWQRDHWRQAIYTRCSSNPLVRKQLADGLGAGATLEVTAHHDDDEIWFDIGHTYDAELRAKRRRHAVSESQAPRPRRPLAPACTCGAHCVHSRSVCWAMNDTQRNLAAKIAGFSAPTDADCGDGLFAQLRWVQQLSGAGAPELDKSKCRVEIFAQPICCPPLTRQATRSTLRICGIDLSGMNALRGPDSGLVVPRTVHLWQYPHTVLSPPALLCSVSPEDLEPLEQGMSEVGKPKPNSCLFFLLLANFSDKTDHFAKTSSGQKQRKLNSKGRFALRLLGSCDRRSER
jgi:hypothetical protein